MRAGIWDVAYDGGDGDHEYASTTGAFAYGAEWAAGWMIAILGMAHAIRETRHQCDTCGEWTRERRHKLPCHDCGAPTTCDRALCDTCEFPERAMPRRSEEPR